MHKSLPFVLLLFISFSTYAQLGIIKDPDGFCNVRADAGNQSKIEDTLTNGRFVYHLEDDEIKNNWVLVDYHKGKDHHTGYIHKSRIVFLKDLTAFKEINVKDTLLTLQLNDMQITMKAGKFVRAGRNVRYQRYSSEEVYTIEVIDGKTPWGTDGRMPLTEYKSIQFKSGAHTLTFPRSSFNDLFEIGSLRGTSARLDKTTGKVYIEAGNGDAAGSYIVAWVINNGKIEYREEFIPF
jgi:hypothetical protein